MHTAKLNLADIAQFWTLQIPLILRKLEEFILKKIIV